LLTLVHNLTPALFTWANMVKKGGHYTNLNTAL